MTTSEGPDLGRILNSTVFVAGASRRFGELTGEQVRAHADELRAATGWGPTARVAPVARAWRELSIEMQRAGVEQVDQVDPALLSRLAGPLWIVIPGF